MGGGAFDPGRTVSTLSHASWNGNLAPCLRVPVAHGAAFIHAVAATFDEVLAACEVVSCFLETCTLVHTLRAQHSWLSLGDARESAIRTSSSAA